MCVCVLCFVCVCVYACVCVPVLLVCVVYACPLSPLTLTLLPVPMPSCSAQSERGDLWELCPVSASSRHVGRHLSCHGRQSPLGGTLGLQAGPDFSPPHPGHQPPRHIAHMCNVTLDNSSSQDTLDKWDFAFRNNLMRIQTDKRCLLN